MPVAVQIAGLEHAPREGDVLRTRGRIPARMGMEEDDTGGIEQNGPYLVANKHGVVLQAMTESIARALGNTLVAPIVDFVPEGIKGPALLEQFIRGKRHIVAVIDEFGGFEGIVTLEDVLEQLLGSEIVDEHDQHVDMQDFARRQASGAGATNARTGTA